MGDGRSITHEQALKIARDELGPSMLEKNLATALAAVTAERDELRWLLRRAGGVIRIEAPDLDLPNEIDDALGRSREYE